MSCSTHAVKATSRGGVAHWLRSDICLALLIALSVLAVAGVTQGQSAPPQPDPAAQPTAGPPDQPTALDPDIERILRSSIEELMNTQVMSVAGVAQDWFRSPAAVTVITQEDIRRTGHRSIAEILRTVPGVFVGQINSQSYIVSPRGFSNGLANKTLVLMDGRTVYDPFFGGTFWNVQDTVLDDIERIEVIRGPGPTLWGSNAVNGVINIVTKNARDTQGTLITGGGGTYDLGFAAVRHGMQLDENSWVRVFGKWLERDAMLTPTQDSAHDDWNMWRAGMRFDRLVDHETWLTIQSDGYYSDRIGESILLPVPNAHLMFARDTRDGHNSGAYALARIAKSLPDHGFGLQGYYDHTRRVTNAGFTINRHTFDVEWRHYFALADDSPHQLMYGLGARHTRDDTSPGPNTSLDPASRSLDTFSAFVQDTITLQPDRLFAMIGSKFEYNDYTDFEVQPSARIWFTPNEQSTYWAAISRPVRVPTRAERDATFTLGVVDAGLVTTGTPSGTFVPLEFVGNPDLKPEELISYEVGVRLQPASNLAIGLATFYNDYQRLMYLPQGASFQFSDEGYGESYGAEVSMVFDVAENWRLRGSYSFIDVQIHGPILPDDEETAPHHMAQIRSYLDITHDVQFNSALYYVDQRPASEAGKYIRLDLGLNWRPNPNLDIAVWGQNLLDPAHPEVSSNQVERAVYLQATFRF